jgi:AcrR family transcriptional regulator
LSTKLEPESTSPLGLRERKRLKTMAAIQEHALRLFREQGYDATTVEQIAAAAEVAPRTIFRYFDSKEDVVLLDAYDPLLMEAFESQPAEYDMITAVRAAMHEVYDGLDAETLAGELERWRLINSVPKIRARMLDELTRGLQLFARSVAKRLGRAEDDFGAAMYAGAFMGVMIAAWFVVAADPEPDLVAGVDRALDQVQITLRE